MYWAECSDLLAILLRTCLLCCKSFDIEFLSTQTRNERYLGIPYVSQSEFARLRALSERMKHREFP
jgi:hypothetical protein